MSHQPSAPPATTRDVVAKFIERVQARIPGSEVITAATLPGKTGREIYLPQASVALWRVQGTRVGLDGRITATLTMVAPRRNSTSAMNLAPTDLVVLLPRT